MMTGSVHVTFTIFAVLLIVKHSISQAPANYDEFGTDCKKRNTCVYSPNVSSTKMNCHCSQSCTIFDDCCEDAVVDGDRFSPKERESMQDTVTCMPVNYIASRAPIYITKQCAASYPNGYIRDRCEGFNDALPLNVANLQKDPYMFVPVTSTRTEMLFINVYCALCNSEEAYTFWDVEYVHENASFDESLFENIHDLTGYLQAFPLDRIDMTHTTHSVHVCKQENRLIDTCPQHWRDDIVRDSCAGTALYVYQGITAYHNMYCAQCHSKAADDVSCVDSKWQLGSSDIRPPPAFSLLLDFNAGGGQFVSGQVGKTIPSNAESCQPGHAWDPFKLQCIYLLCPKDKTFVNDGCYGDGKTAPVVDMDINVCPLIKLNSSEFIIDSDSNMIVTIYNLTLSEGDYFLNSTHAYICALKDFFYPVIKFNAIQGYLTMVGNVISIICVITMLIVYSLYAPLRNTPGIALMCLASALGMGQLLFSIGIHGHGSFQLCYCMSLGIHFAFLSYFCWMNIVAFDIWSTFRSNLRDSSRGKIRYKRLALYGLYAWGIPILIIVVSVILDSSSAGNPVRPYYAVSLCFLNSRMGLLILFAVPLALVMVFDIIFFVLTVKNIRQVSKGSKAVRRNCPDTTQLFLFIKLAFVMGLTWIMGFIAALTDVEALWYIFILLNSFQGVWILISFVCTEKVRRLTKEPIRRRKGRLSETRSSSSTRHTYLSARYSESSSVRFSSRKK